LTFILRNARGDDLRHIAFSEDQYEDALVAFETEKPVTIVTTQTPGVALAELVSLTFSTPEQGPEILSPN
jgi:hypothetical protein